MERMHGFLVFAVWEREREREVRRVERGGRFKWGHDHKCAKFNYYYYYIYYIWLTMMRRRSYSHTTHVSQRGSFLPLPTYTCFFTKGRGKMVSLHARWNAGFWQPNFTTNTKVLIPPASFFIFLFYYPIF